jgi:Sulfotransferase family
MKESIKIDHYGVILGCPRSGTSFLGHSLRALPHSEILFGYHLPVTVPHLLNRPLSDDVRQALAYGFRELLNNYMQSLHNSILATGRRWAQGKGSFSEVLEALQRRRPVQWLIYKEPVLSFAPEFAWEAFPGVRLIHIVRDGRDCADSLVRTYDSLSDERLKTLEAPEAPIGTRHGDRFVPWWVEASREAEFLAVTQFARAAWMWKEMTRRCHRFFSDSNIKATARVLEVKYEELVTAPVTEGRRIVDFLGVEWNRRLEKQFRKARSNSIGIHKRRDPKEIAEATRIASAELELYGYL